MVHAFLAIDVGEEAEQQLGKPSPHFLACHHMGSAFEDDAARARDHLLDRLGETQSGDDVERRMNDQRGGADAPEALGDVVREA